MPAPAPDRLVALLDAVLADERPRLADMAAGAHLSAFHLSRQLSAATGEPPVALRRRVLLERAAWQLQRGARVTDVALAAGYDSVDGFARAFGRAFGHPPSQLPPAVERGHWLPAPNGIHFHGPSVLYVAAGEAREHPAGDVLEMLVRHDIDDVRALLLTIQNDLFDVGADLCTPVIDEPEHPPLRITDAYISALETACDDYNERLEPLRSFVLPGGTLTAAYLHVARTVVRRAERTTWAALDTYHGGMNPLTATYLNRLSDLLFILARIANAGDDVLWQPGARP